MTTETQADGILRLLRDKPDGVTALDVLEAGYGIRAAARVSDLRQRGYVITTDRVKRGRATVGLYRLREQLPLW